MPDIEKLLQPTTITALMVRGYKSLSQAQRIEIRPLTILAGANSSGKSSMMQPLLLLKQTLEAPYDPGVLLLNGPHVRITSVDQLLSKPTTETGVQSFTVACEIGHDRTFAKPETKKIGLTFKKAPEKGLEIAKMTYQEDQGETFGMYPDMPHAEIIKVLPATIRQMYETLWLNMQPTLNKAHLRWMIKRDRCFLDFAIQSAPTHARFSVSPSVLTSDLVKQIQQMIHLSGLRGNPERTYRTAAIGEQFPGDFREYVASILYDWQQTQSDKLQYVSNALRELDLTWKIEAQPVDDTSVELRVGRLSYADPEHVHDVVSIADAGFGVSQVLPVIVALCAAQPGQIVYLEQPEIHLHPNAQHKMATLFAEAAKRGVRVIIETHSSLLLTGIQTLIASHALPPELVKLHWFSRTSGVTTITSTDVDEYGAFGEWPQDFDDVTLRAEHAYLNAVATQEELSR